MTATPPAHNQRWRARPWLWVVLAVMLAFTIGIYRLRRLNFGSESTDLNIHLDDWRFGSSETREVYNHPRLSLPMEFVTKRFLFGPLHFTKIEMPPQPLGTNAVQVGDILYDPTTKREVWRVLAVEKQHEFDDDTVHDGVLVRSSINGGENWMPKEKLGKALVGR